MNVEILRWLALACGTGGLVAIGGSVITTEATLSVQLIPLIWLCMAAVLIGLVPIRDGDAQ